MLGLFDFVPNLTLCGTQASSQAKTFSPRQMDIRRAMKVAARAVALDGSLLISCGRRTGLSCLLQLMVNGQTVDYRDKEFSAQLLTDPTSELCGGNIPIIETSFLRTLMVWLTGLALSQAADVSAPLKQQAVRREAPLFELLNANGKPVALPSFRGKPVLLDLWATKCGGCVKEIPYFIDISQAYAPRGLAVIGVSMDILYEDLRGPAEAWGLVKPFVADHHVTYPILMGDDSFTKSYSVTALPVTYLIDKRGRIAATYIGVVDRADLEKNVKALLSE